MTLQDATKSDIYTRITAQIIAHLCGSAWKKDPVDGVIGVQKGPQLPLSEQAVRLAICQTAGRGCWFWRRC